MAVLEEYRFLEITTCGNCDVRCTKYCPHEVYRKAYNNPDEQMTLETFKGILDNVPTDVVINFAGYCEPFNNVHCMDMIRYAFKMGYKVALYTTLNGFNDDIDELSKMPFLEFCLHTPDAYNNAKINIDEDYGNKVVKLMQNQKELSFSTMNNNFRSNDRENNVRGKSIKNCAFLPRSCIKFKHPQFVVLPNGDTLFCCMDFGLTHKIGNLLTTCFDDIAKTAKRPKELCTNCWYNIFVPAQIGRRIWVLRQRLL